MCINLNFDFQNVPQLAADADGSCSTLASTGRLDPLAPPISPPLPVAGTVAGLTECMAKPSAVCTGAAEATTPPVPPIYVASMVASVCAVLARDRLLSLPLSDSSPKFVKLKTSICDRDLLLSLVLK